MRTLTEPWVVKLGGSLARGTDLKHWLEFLRRHRGTPLLVVAGGGEFADTVRRSQQDWGFSDQAGHRMAVRAMEQYACMIADLAGGLPTVSGLEACRQALQQQSVVVWLPALDVDRHCRLPAVWELTSDSLALWLAQSMGFSNLALVKSVYPDSTAVSGGDIVDDCLPDLLQTSSVKCWWLGPGQSTELEAAMVTGDTGELCSLHGLCANTEQV